ncbi:hypothetical protein [Rouxiella sp. WC2420]|uniref:Uncharacterized protein n=1 Tax=Rouxiella sp. WC2420 TaxID=3234145 RepID=A0AB39VMT1_9GAMM
MRKIRLEVDEFERAAINAGVRDVIRATNLKDAPNSQLYRVIQAAMGPDWHTLRDLELLVLNMFGQADTQPAISARLREVDPMVHGLRKDKRVVRDLDTGKQVWFYRLVATNYEDKAA